MTTTNILGDAATMGATQIMGTQIMGMQMQGNTKLPPIPWKIVECPNGDWLGIATVRTPLGPVTVKATASPNKEAMALIAKLRASGATSGFLGGLFKSAKRLFKSAAKIAKKVAQGKILSALKHSAKMVFKNPLIRKAIGFASVPFVGPMGAKLIPMGLRAAGGLLFKAKTSRRARLAMKRVILQARRGNYQAVQMSRYLIKARRIAQRRGWGAFRQPRQSRQPQYRRNRWGQLVRVAGEEATTTTMYAGEDANGQWLTTAAGEQVFVPHAYGSLIGTLELAPDIIRTGMPAARTFREAYRLGLQSSPR